MQTQLAFEYDGKASAIIGKIAKYAALNLITLFIYRFWTKTHLRRYFWSSVRLDGENFAYHGTGKELFIGFVIFFCLFFCFYVANELALLLLADDMALYAIYSIIVAIGFIFLFHMAIFRMLKYRLTRTSWKGVRFGLDGKARTYAGKAMLLYLVSILSLGLAYPWVRASLINYRLKRCRFGNSHFTSLLKGGQLALVYYMSKLPLLVALTAVIIFAVKFVGAATFTTQEAMQEVAMQIMSNNTWIAGLFFAGVITGAILKIFYRLFEAKTVVSHLQFKDIIFTNKLKLLTSVIAFAVLSVLYYALTFAALFSAGFIFGINPWLLPLIFPIYVIYLFASIGLLNWIIARLILATSLAGDTDILKDVTSYRKDEPTHGEGLFEILDIGNL